jgi:predicted transcriptional regulator
MDTKVKELMIPLENYPKVSKDANYFQAVDTLLAAHDRLQKHTYRPRSVLVTDENGKVVGKINLWDAMRALEPKYGNVADFNRLTHFGVNPDFLRSMVEKHDLWNDPLDTLCEKAAVMRVETFMSHPHADEYIPEDSTLAAAVHQMVMGRQMALLVTKCEAGDVVGLVRLCDLFEFISQKIKTCQI